MEKYEDKQVYTKYKTFVNVDYVEFIHKAGDPANYKPTGEQSAARDFENGQIVDDDDLPF